MASQAYNTLFLSSFFSSHRSQNCRSIASVSWSFALLRIGLREEDPKCSVSSSVRASVHDRRHLECDKPRDSDLTSTFEVLNCPHSSH